MICLFQQLQVLPLLLLMLETKIKIPILFLFLLLIQLLVNESCPVPLITAILTSYSGVPIESYLLQIGCLPIGKEERNYRLSA
jgi:hypothetical protein